MSRSTRRPGRLPLLLTAFALAASELSAARFQETPPGSQDSRSADSLLLTGVRIVDARSAEASPPTQVLIAGGRIRGVGASLSVPDGAQRVDAGGKWLIPGLWDLHVHLVQCGEGCLGAFVARGVLGVRDMGGDLATVKGWRKEIESGARVGPDILAAGPVLESPQFLMMLDRVAGMLPEDEGSALRSSVAGRLGVGSVEEAKAVVGRLAGMGVDHIKIRSALSVEVYRAIAAAAREAGLALVGHAPEQVVPLLDCARAGQRSVEHSSFTVGPSMLGPDDLEDVISALKESGTVLVPTLVADQSFRLSDAAALRAHVDAADESPLRRYATPQMLAFWRAQLGLGRFEGPIDWEGMIANAVEVIRALHAAGIPVLPGTDLGVVGLYPGFALHDELRLMQQKLDMSPHAVLSAATLGAATLVGRDADWGTVEPGKRAELVLLDADPLESAANVSKIHGVVRRGRWLDAAALDAILGEVARAAKDG